MEWWEDRILSAQNGTNPMLILETNAGYAVFGDVQFLPGYCVLLPKHEVSSLNDLELEERTQFLQDMSLVGDAIIKVCNPSRVNYDILGNTDKFLHAHIFPRYIWEDKERQKMPVWTYDKSNWSNEETLYSEEKYGQLKQMIKSKLDEIVRK
ncbi:hypothetical protein BG262_02535 [Floricoccus penangensis]|uniref:HIT domain-containing protein n=1 Tax=Floricoccus penangensis TaxID=1859475 RepID=A0A9Q5JG02_9LACT|nr:HIT domain-containing protein [Floricoccus penangensis]OFI46697.1 hypothetical protein BG262_02535 [Floricoccus penangensis]